MKPTPRREPTAHRWLFLAAPRGFRSYLVVVELLVAALVAWRVGDTGFGLGSPGTLIMLVVVAIGFEEGASRIARLQIRLSAPMRTDMVSVWAVAGAVSLSAFEVTLLMLIISVYVWFRQQRPAGEPLYRKFFVATTIVGGAVAAGAVATALSDGVGDRASALPSQAVAVVAAIVVFAVFNRGLVSGGLIVSGVPVRELFGTRHDNLTELATLCLGGLVAMAVFYEPWLAVLVVAPLITLQRGAVVRELEAAAITDGKTGLLNAVAWEQLAQRELLRAQRVDGRVALLIIDIDRFKIVNDRYGHLVGDKVLAGVAKAAEESLRGYDGLGRFGGEEFVAVLPDADERGALVIAERVRIRVNQLRMVDLVPGLPADPGRADVELSVSIGVAVLNSDGAELHDLLHAADQALYRAKWSGRNQVQLAGRGDQRPDTVTL